ADRVRLIALFGTLGLAGGLVTASASCANSTETGAESDAGATSIPSPPVESPDDAGAKVDDAGCDAGGLGCTPPPATCDDGAWCAVTTPLDPRLGLAAVWGTSKADVWAVGAGGTILHFDGTTWAATPSGTTEAIYAIWGSGPTDLWAVSSAQKILRSTGF